MECLRQVTILWLMKRAYIASKHLKLVVLQKSRPRSIFPASVNYYVLYMIFQARKDIEASQYCFKCVSPLFVKLFFISYIIFWFH